MPQNPKNYTKDINDLADVAKVRMIHENPLGKSGEYPFFEQVDASTYNDKIHSQSTLKGILIGIVISFPLHNFSPEFYEVLFSAIIGGIIGEVIKNKIS